ncbi:hypothetical protein D3C87_1436720 [compost metagenome]
MLGDDLAVQRSQQRYVTHVEITARDLLDDDAGGHAVQAAATEFFRQFAAEQTHFTHLPDHRAFNLAADVALAVTGRKYFGAKAGNAFTNSVLLFVECEVHDALQARAGGPAADKLPVIGSLVEFAELGLTFFLERGDAFLGLFGVVIQAQGLHAEGTDAGDIGAVGVE